MATPANDPDETSSPEAVAKRDARRLARLAPAGVAGVLVAWFALTNHERIVVHFWLTSAHASVFVVIAIAFVLGFALAWPFARRRRRS